METLLTKQIKAKLLKHYRFEKNYYVGQEVNEMDVFVMSKDYKNLIEIEIKITKADLKNELHKKKHVFRSKLYTPTQFYFCVPEFLIESAEAMIKELKRPDYGIINSETLEVFKRAKKASITTSALPKCLFERVTSDLANKYDRLMHVEENLKWLEEKYISDITNPLLVRVYKHMFKYFDSNDIESTTVSTYDDRVEFIYKGYKLALYGDYVIRNGYTQKYSKKLFEYIINDLEKRR